MEQRTIALIGAGNMTTSLIGGLINDGYDPGKIIVSNPTELKLELLKKSFGIMVTTANQQAALAADVVVIAVKPHVIKEVVIDLVDVIKRKKCLVISIAAGIRTTSLAQWLGSEIPLIRCMPNTPALVGTGATALYANSVVSESQKEIAESIMRAVGISVWVEQEQQLDTVTALSGSGPAYFLLVMEVLSQAAHELGLPADTAKLLTLQTALGAARMALESDDSIEQLRHKVTSPGGTTEQALNVLEENHIGSIFAKAMASAKLRSEELASLF